MTRFSFVQTSLLLAVAVGLSTSQGCGSVYSPLASSGQPSAGACSETSSTIDTMEEQDFFTQLCTTWKYFISDPGGISTVTARFEPGSDLPGGTPGTSLRFFGHIYNTSWQDFVNIQVPFPDNFNIDINAPNGRVVFSYKVGSVGVGMAHSVGFSHPEPCDPPAWAFYTYSFTPPDTSWREQIVYLPGANGGVNEFRRNWGCSSPNADWGPPINTKEKITSLNFNVPNPPTGGDWDYDLSLDDVRFE